MRERFIYLKDPYQFILMIYSKKNNFGLVNSGVTSYSPSLMKVQYRCY